MNIEIVLDEMTATVNGNEILIAGSIVADVELDFDEESVCIQNLYTCPDYDGQHVALHTQARLICPTEYAWIHTVADKAIEDMSESLLGKHVPLFDQNAEHRLGFHNA